MAPWDRSRNDGFTTATWINALAGLWLIASPWIYGVFGDGAPGAWNSIVVSILIALAASVELASPRANANLSWIRERVLGLPKD